MSVAPSTKQVNIDKTVKQTILEVNELDGALRFIQPP